MKQLPKLMIALGALVLAYVATSVLWREPASDLYARVQQHELARELDRATAAYAEGGNANSGTDSPSIAARAGSFRNASTLKWSTKDEGALLRVPRGRPVS